MIEPASDLLDRLQRQRSAIVRGFLWILLGVVAASLAINAALLGDEILDPGAWAPNLVFVAVLVGALWLNGRGRDRAALGIVMALVLGAQAIGVLTAGVGGNEINLLLFLVPVVLAGLLLDRPLLWGTAAFAAAVVLLAPALHGAGMLLGTPAASDPDWSDAFQFTLVLAIVTFFLDRFGLVLPTTLRRAVEHEAALHHETAERLRTSEALQERREQLAALHTIDQAITGGSEVERAAEEVLNQVERRLSVDAARILRYRPESAALESLVERGFADASPGAWEDLWGETPAGRAGRTRERVALEGGAQLREAFDANAALEGAGFESCLAVPLVAQGELQGVLELFHRGPLPHGQDWHAFLDTLATQASIALHNASMVADLERSNRALRSAYETTIEGWARALDLKDEETEGHSRRVAAMALELAARMGVDEDVRMHMRWGALLHDIGKMGVPDQVLSKAGRLTKGEAEVLKRHTTLARDLLQPIPFLRQAIDIPYAHHERWDGSGYPLGLSGEAIPLPARIFAVVDVFDALTNDRPYRRAWREDEALAHIRAGAGTLFDPDVVDVFLDWMEARHGAPVPA